MNPNVPRNAAVATYHNYADAEAAIRILQSERFDLRRLSLIGLEAQRDAVGCYNVGERMKCWGSFGGFWERIWELLSGSGFFSMPELGRVLVAGPFTACIIAALDNAAIFHGLNPVGSALYSIGIPRNKVLEYEAALMGGKLLLVAHGSAELVESASRHFRTTDADPTRCHNTAKRTLLGGNHAE